MAFIPAKQNRYNSDTFSNNHHHWIYEPKWQCEQGKQSNCFWTIDAKSYFFLLLVFYSIFRRYRIEEYLCDIYLLIVFSFVFSLRICSSSDWMIECINSTTRTSVRPHIATFILKLFVLSRHDWFFSHYYFTIPFNPFLSADLSLWWIRWVRYQHVNSLQISCDNVIDELSLQAFAVVVVVVFFAFISSFPFNFPLRLSYCGCLLLHKLPTKWTKDENVIANEDCNKTACHIYILPKHAKNDTTVSIISNEKPIHYTQFVCHFKL